jgi:hypothetical protein
MMRIAVMHYWFATRGGAVYASVGEAAAMMLN